MNLLVDHIGELLTCTPELGRVHDACVLVVEGRVRYAGARDLLHARDVPTSTTRIDAAGRLVTPGLVEPHAHPIWAGSRAGEFALRSSGATYLEIQAAGGGILSTVRATRDATDDDLVASTQRRLSRFLAHGTTFVEAKTGYALSIEGELRLLELLHRSTHAVGLSPTLLAHVPPPIDLDGIDRETYVRRFCEEAIPRAARDGLADAVDVYCDEGAFDLGETRRILSAAKERGLMLRVHAEQFTHTGAADLAAELGARSVEHMERPGEGTPARLAAAGTVVNLLPGAALTLRLPWPDARRFIEAGCKVALGTDCNPGSSLTESQPLMMSLAVTQLAMTVEEAWLGVTRHAAQAVGRADRGHLGTGAIGDVVVWDTDDHRELVQHLGGVAPKQVFVGGALAHAA
ncbi:MAG: imidazolonepropionase [Polyangia bacterium]